MEQKCSLWNVFSVFVDEPLKIHYAKEISRKIKLAPTSVKIHLNYLLERNIIAKKKGERFFGFIANRENTDFLFYKRVFNLMKLKESGLLDFLINSLYPNAIVLYGSFMRGEDVEESDIDLFILTKVRKSLEINKFQAVLKRNIHLIMEVDFNKLAKELKSEIINGTVLYGYLK